MRKVLVVLLAIWFCAENRTGYEIDRALEKGCDEYLPPRDGVVINQILIIKDTSFIIKNKQ